MKGSFGTVSRIQQMANIKYYELCGQQVDVSFLVAGLQSVWNSNLGILLSNWLCGIIF